jgi:hypothetical protein
MFKNAFRFFFYEGFLIKVLKTSVGEKLQNTYAEGKELLKRLGSAYVSMLTVLIIK